MSRLQRNFLFIALTTAAASSVSLLGGLGLEHVSAKLLPIVPLIVALPGLNDLVGDYSSIIAAHTGNPDERRRSHRELSAAIARVVSVNITAIIVLSLVLAMVRGYIADWQFIVRFACFVAAAVVIVITLMFGLARTLDQLMLKRRLNPDELLIPIVTSVADVLMLVLITLGAYFVF